MPLAEKVELTFPGETKPITFRINYGTRKDGTVCVWCNLEKIQLEKRVEADKASEIRSIIYDEHTRRENEVTTYKFWLVYAIGCVRLPIQNETVEKIESIKFDRISFLASHERLVRFWYSAYWEKYIGDKLVSSQRMKEYIPENDDFFGRVPALIHDIDGRSFCAQGNYFNHDTQKGIKVEFRGDLWGMFKKLESTFASLVDQLVEKLIVPEAALLEMAQSGKLLTAPTDD